MPLDKNMSHSDMVAELIKTYKRTGKIGATAPRDMEHALEIANAVAYNIGESKEIEIINNEVNEMDLSQILETLEGYLSSKEKELGIVNEGIATPYEVILYRADEKWAYSGAFKTLEEAKAFVLNNISDYPNAVSFEIRKIEEGGKAKSLGGGKADINKEDMEVLVSEALEALEDGATVKVTLDNGQSFDVPVDKDTKEEEIKKMYPIDKEVGVQGPTGQQKQARVKDVTLLKPVGEDFDAEYKEAEDTLSKYFTNASDIMRVLDSQVEDQGVQGIKETLAKLQKLIDGETYHLSKTFRNTYTVFDTNSNPYLDFFIDDDEKIKFSELDLDEALKNPQAEVIENPINVVSMDIPLLLRILEWAREDSTKDEDLHFLTENLIKAMVNTEFLAMEDYESVIPCCCEETPAEELDLPMEVEEPIEVEESMSEEDMGDMGADPIAPVGAVQSQIGKTKKGKALKRTYKVNMPRH